MNPHICLMLFSLAHKHKHKNKENIHVRFSCTYMRLCLCASESSIRQISVFVLLIFLLMLTLMSRVFSFVMLMLCLCTSVNHPLNSLLHKLPTGSTLWLTVSPLKGKRVMPQQLHPMDCPCQQSRYRCPLQSACIA